MNILFLHGWQSTPGGVKPTYLKDHGHEVLNPALPDDDFDAAVRIAQEACERSWPRHQCTYKKVNIVVMNVFVDANIFIRVATQGRPGCEPEHFEDLRTLVEDRTFTLLVPEVVYS